MHIKQYQNIQHLQAEKNSFANYVEGNNNCQN